MICPDCDSASIRPAHFHLRDLSHAVLLRFPVRCRLCHCRFYVSALTALHINNAHRLRHKDDKKAGRVTVDRR